MPTSTTSGLLWLIFLRLGSSAPSIAAVAVAVAVDALDRACVVGLTLERPGLLFERDYEIPCISV